MIMKPQQLKVFGFISECLNYTTQLRLELRRLPCFQRRIQALQLRMVPHTVTLSLLYDTLHISGISHLYPVKTTTYNDTHLYPVKTTTYNDTHLYPVKTTTYNDKEIIKKKDRIKACNFIRLLISLLRARTFHFPNRLDEWS